MQTAAIIAAILIGVVTVFQLALALGLPAGRASWGGRHEGVLPTRLRVASGFAAIFAYPLIIFVVLDAADVIGSDEMPDIGASGMWVLTGLFALGAVANFASRSPVERLWGPVSLVIAVCCAIVAWGL